MKRERSTPKPALKASALYSFPDEDLNIRSLFTRALASRSQPPFITAIQFGANPQTRIRYEAFFR